MYSNEYKQGSPDEFRHKYSFHYQPIDPFICPIFSLKSLKKNFKVDSHL